MKIVVAGISGVILTAIFSLYWTGTNHTIYDNENCWYATYGFPLTTAESPMTMSSGPWRCGGFDAEDRLLFTGIALNILVYSILFYGVFNWLDRKEKLSKKVIWLIPVIVIFVSFLFVFLSLSSS